MSNSFPFADMFKQSFDLNELFAIQRRNIEAFSAANQALIEGAQAVSRRQADVVRDNVEQVMSASREAFSHVGTPETSLNTQSELTRELMENSLSNLREVTEMVTKTSFEAFDVLNKRATESLEEINQTAPTTRKKKAA